MKTYVYDIECLPNIFTFAAVNLIDDDDKVEFVIMYDKLDNNHIDDRLKLISFINLEQYLISYNGSNYDDIMLKYIIMNYHSFRDLKIFTNKLYNFSKELVGNEYLSKFQLAVKWYNSKFKGIDAMSMFALDKPPRKGLKAVLINIKYHSINEYQIPPVTQKEFECYYNNFDDIKTTALIDWYDRYMIHDNLKDFLVYNWNDVFGLKALVVKYISELKLRYNISFLYNINVLSASRAKVADTILIKEYEKATGQRYKDFKDYKTEYRILKIGDAISDKIRFKTDMFKDILNKLRVKNITAMVELKQSVHFDGTIYNMGGGGLHSDDIPRVLNSTDEYVYRDADVTSFYPMIMVRLGIKPRHVDKAFFDIIVRLIKRRVEAKHNGDIDVANILKIVINSIFGKLGFEFGWLYDRMAMLRVTINGQLFLFMLIERLALAGIKTVSANTDGIVCKIPKDKEDIYYSICKQWEQDLKLELEYTDYKKLVYRDVNNYITVKEGNKIKRKGDLNYKKAEDDLKKAFTMPIIAIAIEKYFIDGISIKETIKSHDDIYDYCSSQNVGGTFTLEYHKIVNNELTIETLQKNNRYFVSNKGGTLIKRSDINKGGDNSTSVMIGGNTVTILNECKDSNAHNYNINYNYYIKETTKWVDVIQYSLNTKRKQKGYYVPYNYKGLFD